MNQKRAIAPSKGLDVFGAVEELHNLSAKEMNKLLRDSQNIFTLRLRTGWGSYLRVNLERLVSQLPLHLLACLASRGLEPRLRYLLRGVRLLHSLSDLALRHPKLAQIFLHEVKIREQILDLIIYMLITLAGPEQEGRHGSSFTILHAALVACSLHLLPAFVDGEWSDLVPVLLVHPKVDIFMDATFDAVRRDIGLLQNKLRALNSKLMSNQVSANVAESMAEVIAQQCEASVQALQSLCQPQAFRDKVLNHKELGRNGGVLQLVLAVLKLQVPLLLAESQYLVSLVARLKSKILSLMIRFCETELVSFLDEVAADARTMHLAEMVAAEVLTLVRKSLLEEHTEPQASDDEEEDEMPSGLLYIHALRLADVFSDDSNFRNSVMDFIAPDLAKVLAQSPTAFLARWCGTSITEEIRPGSDSVLIYDPFRAAGAAMHSFKSTGGASVRASGSNAALLPDDSSGCSLSAGKLQFASYSQERSSLFVKILANLHCFNPEICPANEKDRFLNLFVDCLMSGPFIPGNSDFFLSTVQTAVRVCENLFMLLDHVSSLSSDAVSDEDLQLVSTFYCALHETICPSPIPEDYVQEDPVVAYVRDAHEQKRKALLGQWQKSERWKRLHLFEPSDDHDESKAGSSINKTTSNSSLSQPAGNEQDTCGFVEEAQDDDELSGAKRSREASETDEGAGPTKRKRHKSSELWGVDLRREMGAEAQVVDGGVRGCTSVVMEDEVANEDTLHLIATHIPIAAAAAPGDVAQGFAIHIESADSAGAQQRDENGTSPGDCREHIDERGVEREHKDVLDDKKLLPSSEAALPQGTSTRDIAPTPCLNGAFFYGNDRHSFPSKDSAMLQGNLTRETAITMREHEKHAILEVHYDNTHHEEPVGETEVERLVNAGNLAIFVDGNNLEGPNSANCGAEKLATGMVNLDSCKMSTHADAAVNDKGGSPSCIDYAGEKNEAAADGVGMDHGDLIEGNSSDFDSARVGTSNTRTSVGQMDAVCDGCAGTHRDKAVDKFATITSVCETAHCPESSMGEGSLVKREKDGRSPCVQGFSFGLEAEDFGAPEVAVRIQPLATHLSKDVIMLEDQHHDSLRHLAAVVNAEPEVKWGLSQNNMEVCVPGASNVCVPEASKVCLLKVSQVPLVEASGQSAVQAFGLGDSQLCVTKGSLVPTFGTSSVSASDTSRFGTAMEAKDYHAFGGCPLPKPMPLPITEEFPVRKRKRNIMSYEQMAVMENALKTEPYMRRHPELIMQMTHTLNKMGPEVSYQQLKNWLNNRKARLARQRAADPSSEVRCVYNQEGSAPGSSTCSGSSNDPNRSTSEDGGNTRDSGSTSQARKSLPSFGIPLCKLATEDIDAIMDFDMSTLSRSHMSSDLAPTNGTFVDLDAYGRHNLELSEMGLVSGSSAPVKFVKCETGQFVSLLDKDGKEAATGTLYQVEGIWQGKRIDEHGICIVKIADLNVDKSSRLPHPSPFTGSTFEEAEKLCGQMLVAWDTKCIFLIS